jgi:hypothetical protein
MDKGIICLLMACGENHSPSNTEDKSSDKQSSSHQMIRQSQQLATYNSTQA